MTAPARICAVVPGVPVSKGRPRVDSRPGKGPRIFLAPRERDWKATAQAHMATARDTMLPEGEPVALTIRAYWPHPKSWAKRRAGAEWKAGRPDSDRIASAVLDAGIGVWWSDDAQVVSLVVEKRYAAQGEPPRVEVECAALAANGAGNV